MIFRHIKSQGVAYNSCFHTLGDDLEGIGPYHDYRVCADLAQHRNHKTGNMLEALSNDDYVIVIIELKNISSTEIYDSFGSSWICGIITRVWT